MNYVIDTTGGWLEGSILTELRFRDATDGLGKSRVVLDRRFRIQYTLRTGCMGMEAFSGLTAHKPPRRNHEPVTGQT